jgi:undecaprenyl diphosphate synthase
MDGNRRWAQRYKLSKTINKSSIDAIERTIFFCLKNKIIYLSLYAFSLENLHRSSSEVSFLFSILVDQLQIKRDFFLENDICVKFVGDKNCFPYDVLQQVNTVEQITSTCKTLTVLFYVCYGGQQEIIAAAQACVQAVKQKKINFTQIDTKFFSSFLWTPSGTPPPSVVIRTGGHKRLSNFLLFQVAYTELYFLDSLWPDISDNDLQNILDAFNKSQKNFGK